MFSTGRRSSVSFWLLLVGSLFAFASGSAVGAACAAPATGAAVASSAQVQVAWRAQDAAIVVGQPFVLLLDVCPVTAQLLSVDARMPEHRHGMNYRPSLVALGGGRWRAEGLLWHMAGRWELSFELQLDGRSHTLRDSVNLP